MYFISVPLLEPGAELRSKTMAGRAVAETAGVLLTPVVHGSTSLPDVNDAAGSTSHFDPDVNEALSGLGYAEVKVWDIASQPNVSYLLEAITTKHCQESMISHGDA
jgi:hypothetical protein